MHKLLAFAVMTTSIVAAAQSETTPPPTLAIPAEPPPAPAAPAPIPPAWNVGAGIGLTIWTSNVGALGGLIGTGFTGPSLATTPQPRMTVLIERRLNERFFFSFQAAVTFSSNVSDTFSALSSRNLSLEGAIGVRRVFNPGGVIEVSWFGNAGVGYSDFEYRNLISSLDPSGMLTSTPQTTRGHSFAVGAVTGLTLERELIAGLGARLSSSILGVSYGSNTSTTSTATTSVDSTNHGFDAGLRFSPALELRYAF